MEPLSILLSLAQFAPSLIRMVTGNEKAEQVASVVVDVAKAVTGTKDAPTAISKLALDPALAAEFAAKIADREADLTKAYLADKDSARRMQNTALQQDDLFAKRFIYLFSAAWSAYSMWFMYYVSYVKPLDQNNAQLILGFLLGTAVASIFQFFYGTTIRSGQKDDTIKALSSSK